MGSRISRLLAIVVITASTVALLAPTAAALAAFARHPWTVTWVATAVTVAAMVAANLVRRVVAVRKGTVIEWDLGAMPPAASPTSPIAALTNKSLTLRQTVETLVRAAADKRVSGLFANLGFQEATMADLQELRGAVAAFRAAGKRAVAYAEAYTNTSYYLASAFDEIVLQPAGEVWLTGFGRDANFLRGALDKVGVVWDGATRYEYKNAYNQLTEKKFTKPHREATERVFECLHDQLVDGVASGRGIDSASVRALIDRAPLLGEEALDAKLVDALAYRDQAIESAKSGTGRKASLLYLDKYRKRAKKPQRGATIALVTATGAIQSRKGQAPPIMPGGAPMDASEVSAALRKATADKRVKAIVMRVVSPGGSAVASETIRREVVRAKEQGKPVVVSMGSVAGSGGYWIACDADRIVAQPATVTGSIGVLLGKPVLAGLKEQAGVSVDRIATGKHATMLSFNRPFARSERARLDASLDDIYDGFTERVARGRRSTVDEVHEIAKGRIWSGSDALERGLVDELGGLEQAVVAAKVAAGLKPDSPVRLRAYPNDESRVAQLRRRKAQSSEDTAAAMALVAALAPLAPIADDLVRVAAAAGLLGDTGSVHAGYDVADWVLR